MDAQELESNLMMFSGTEEYHKLSMFANFKCTDGVKFVADEAKAYWLIDAIASYRCKDEFQVWKLKVENKSAVLTMTDGDSDKAIVRQEIEYTDFPLSSITFYCENDVLMLPSER